MQLLGRMPRFTPAAIYGIQIEYANEGGAGDVPLNVEN
jgi:hypothetical protein